MKHEDDTSNYMSCNVKYSAWIANRVAEVQTTDTFLYAYMNYNIHKSSRSWNNKHLNLAVYVFN